jgi:hypothetical protein
MEMSKWKMVSYSAILLIICIVTFLGAKYVIKKDIGTGKSPIDTSTRLD